MKSHMLYLPGLVVCAFSAATVALSTFSEPVRSALVQPMTFVSLGVLLALFFRMLFDAQCRRGIDAANIELRGGAPWPGKIRPFMFFDPQWGLFGSRMGGRFLQLIRAILFGEFLIALVFSHKVRPDLLVLTASAFGVTVMLTIIHVGLNTETQRV